MVNLCVKCNRGSVENFLPKIRWKNDQDVHVLVTENMMVHPMKFLFLDHKLGTCLLNYCLISLFVTT